ncbi:amidase [Nitratireductor sp. CAU 1489]|uniref:Amidase n=1 Tax=Nitratireductor arenosus TaxID=2682096 RepID=A0A844QKA1_9HYPH|nr:amidase family protein [Nitratireductor arenosus]MVA98468.1 amidase [Nitratireductor arenosus]
MDIEQILASGSVGELTRAYRQKHLSAREAVEWYLARIATRNGGEDGLNAVRELAPRALEEADAVDRRIASGNTDGLLLLGVPVLLKDNVTTADGMAATIGARALADFVPRREATVVARLKHAGAVVLGKTNMTEFADYTSEVMPSEFSGAGGVVRNPRGPRFGRGQGSSIGSAASVAAAFAPVAIGGESQNSIQTPASVAGIVGYKPTVGLVSRAGVAPLVPSQDTIGPFARTVEDAILVAAMMSGPDARDSVTFIRGLPALEMPDAADLRHVTIGVPRVAMADTIGDAPMQRLFEEVLRTLAKTGARIVDPCDIPSARELASMRSSVFRTEFKLAIGEFLREHGDPCGMASLADIIAWNEAHPDAIPYGQSLLLAAEATAGLEDPVYRADRLTDIRLTTTEGIDAALAAAGADVLVAPMGVAAKLTGKAGAPALSLQVAALADGSRFGITLYTSVGQDKRLLSIGRSVERVFDVSFEASGHPQLPLDLGRMRT